MGASTYNRKSLGIKAFLCSLSTKNDRKSGPSVLTPKVGQKKPNFCGAVH